MQAVAMASDPDLATRPLIKLAVADKHVLFREAARAAITDESGLLVVADVDDLKHLIDCVDDARPDVVLVGVEVGGDGIQVCAALKARAELPRVIILNDLPDPDLLARAIEAGADGFLDRLCTLDDLIESIHRVHAGEAVVPPEMLSVLLKSLIVRRREEDKAIGRFSQLSRREKHIVSLLYEGSDAEAMAEALTLSPHTARTHIRNVLEKLGVHSRLEAVALVSRYNLLERFAGEES